MTKKKPVEAPKPTKVKPRTKEELEDYYTTKPGDLVLVDLDPRDQPTHKDK